MVNANKELTQAIGSLNFDKVMKFGQKDGMTIKFIKGADTTSFYHNAVLQTVMFEIANLINQSPIVIKPGSDPPGVNRCLWAGRPCQSVSPR